MFGLIDGVGWDNLLARRVFAVTRRDCSASS
jgi:hypothetical protein